MPGLADAGPDEMLEAIKAFENNLYTSRKNLADPLLFVVLYDPSHPQAPLKPVLIPYTAQDVKRYGGKHPRGKMGLFMANMGLVFHETPPKVMRGALPEWGPGCRLLYVAFAAETFHVKSSDKIGDEVTDFAQLPADRRTDERHLFACDGRGWLYVLSRPDDGSDTEPETMVLACVADLDKHLQFVHDMGRDPHVSNGSALAWGLDVSARALRRSFEQMP